MKSPIAGQLAQISARYDDAGLDDPERTENQRARLLSFLERQKIMREVLGTPFFRDTTVLPLVGGGKLGPVPGPDGQELRWSLWSPHRRLLVDIFPRSLPDDDEMDTRMSFVKEHGLRYGVVAPGYRLTTDALKEWLGP
jgi:hypothetical protein